MSCVLFTDCEEKKNNNSGLWFTSTLRVKRQPAANHKRPASGQSIWHSGLSFSWNLRVLWTHRGREFIVCSTQSAKKKKRKQSAGLTMTAGHQKPLISLTFRGSAQEKAVFESHRNARLYPSLKRLGNSLEIVNSALGICTLQTFVTLRGDWIRPGMLHVWNTRCLKHRFFFFSFLDR